MGQAAAREINELKDVTLKGVVPLKGRGAYGTVFTVKYGGVVCAAKKIHPILTDNVSPEQRKGIKDDFIKECLRCIIAFDTQTSSNFWGRYTILQEEPAFRSW